MTRHSLVGCLLIVAVPCVAHAQVASAAIYDDFQHRLIDPAKWSAGRYICGTGTLECVREVQNGQLRLAVRNVGFTDSDSGAWYSESVLPFRSDVSAAVTAIRSDITVREFNGVPCSANTDDTTHAQVMMGGNCVNSGDGTSADDVLGQLIILVDTTYTPRMDVGIWWGWPGRNYEGYWTHIAYFRLGTPLVAALVWDKANHQFVGTVKVKGAPGPDAQATASYGAIGVLDLSPAADPTKNLYATTAAMNCTSNLSVSHVDALFDNVLIRR